MTVLPAISSDSQYCFESNPKEELDKGLYSEENGTINFENIKYLARYLLYGWIVSVAAFFVEYCTSTLYRYSYFPYTRIPKN